MAAPRDRLEQLEQRVRDLTTARGELKAEIAKQRRRLDAKRESVRTEAHATIERTERDLATTERTLAQAQFEYELEQAMRTARDAFDAMREAASLAVETGGIGSAESDRAVAARLLELAKVRAMQNFLEGRVKDLVKTLRPFVAAHFKAYTRHDDAERRYPAWFADASLFVAYLQDNPLYSLTVEQLIALVGLPRATELLRVDYRAVAELADAEALTDTTGASVTTERLAALRTRKERTPLLELRTRGEQPIEEQLDLIDPRFAERGLGVEALRLDTATTNALRTAGYTLVEQVRASFDTLQSIEGIGPKRAAKILDALVARAAAP